MIFFVSFRLYGIGFCNEQFIERFGFGDKNIKDLIVVQSLI